MARQQTHVPVRHVLSLRHRRSRTSLPRLLRHLAHRPRHAPRLRTHARLPPRATPASPRRRAPTSHPAHSQLALRGHSRPDGPHSPPRPMDPRTLPRTLLPNPNAQTSCREKRSRRLPTHGHPPPLHHPPMRRRLALRLDIPRRTLSHRDTPRILPRRKRLPPPPLASALHALLRRRS